MTNRVYKTASVVTALSIAERGLGFLYRIVLSHLIGAEGLGLYQVSLSIFSVFLTIGTGGIPISVSRLISKNKAENNRQGERGAGGAGILLCLLLTLPASLILGGFGKYFGFLFSDDRCIDVFRILLIGLAFSSVYAVIRGHFWGNKEFLTPSILEIAEEAVMVIVGVLLLQHVETAAQGATLAAVAVVVSYAFSFTASLLCFFAKGGKLATPKNSLKPLFVASMPITSVRAGNSLVNSAIAVLLPAMLIRAGASDSEAMRLFGIVSGMAIPVLFTPSTIIGSLLLVLVPELSEDFYRKNFNRLNANLERGLRASFLISCTLVPLFLVLGNEIGAIAFSNQTAGSVIVRSAPMLLPMSLTMISTGMLNSMGYEKKTFIFYFIGAAAMLVSILILPRFCGVYAYVIGLTLNYVVNAVCNLFLLKKACPKLYADHGKGLCKTAGLALIAILPISLIGQFCENVLSRFFGDVLSLISVTAVMALATFLLYALFGFLPKRKARTLKRA